MMASRNYNGIGRRSSQRSFEQVSIKNLTSFESDKSGVVNNRNIAEMYGVW